MDSKSLNALFSSFAFDVPRAEICCEIGRFKMKVQAWQQAVYWYEQALSLPGDELSGAFIIKDCHDFIPLIQLCVCYDRLGDYQKAYDYHRWSAEIKPDAEAVLLNEEYFQKRLGLG